MIKQHLRRFYERVFPSRARKSAFTRVYRGWQWRYGQSESRSGPGSTLAATEVARRFIACIIETRGVTSILDAPCGDFYWFSQIALPQSVMYHGCDIVEDLIAVNNATHGTPSIRFTARDVRVASLEPVDLIICRDLFRHLPFRDIHRVLENFRKSGSRLLLATTYPEVSENTDLESSAVLGSRPINLCLKPFFMPEPIDFSLDDDGSPESQDGKKLLALWNLQ